jgi:hypothetical protein
MIELVLALVIITIGVVGIVKLIPPASKDPVPVMYHEEASPRKSNYKVGEEMCVRIDLWNTESKINGYLQKGWTVKNMAGLESTIFVIFEKVEVEDDF